MHIAINTAPLSGGHSGRGIGLYTKELISALGKYVPGVDLSFFNGLGSLNPKADVVHYPFFDPFFLTLPWKISKPTVVTIHDLIPISYREHFPRGLRGEIKWQIQRRALRAVARTIITDSQASKREITRLLGFPANQTIAIPLAPREIFHPVKDRKALASIRTRYGLEEDFFLYVGDLNWNKNVSGIVTAFQRHRKTVREGVKLVLIGRAFTDERLREAVEIRALMRELDVAADVVMPGFVSDTDLSAFYSLAIACVYPSFAEGFGFPVLEAQACGCPVVAGDSPGLREIAGPSILVSPSDPVNIQHGFDMIRSLPTRRRSQIVAEGLQWAGKYTWKKVAVETVQAYEKTFNSHTGI